MKRSTIGTGLILILATLLTATTILSFPDRPSRDESTKAIRATAYEMMKAFLTQDVATFKRDSAKRTLDLVALVYEAARQDPRYQQELQNARITNADQFLGYFMLGMATEYLQAMPLPPEAAARRVANDSTVTFISDYQARITLGDSQIAQARLLGRQWKIDLTDWLKRPVLKEVKDPELRAKIQKL